MYLHRGLARSRFEAHEAQLDLLPNLVAQLKPETLTPAHRAIVKALVGRLHNVSGLSYGAVYTDLNQAFHVPSYHAIADEQYEAVCAWLNERIERLRRMGR